MHVDNLFGHHEYSPLFNNNLFLLIFPTLIDTSFSFVNMKLLLLVPLSVQYIHRHVNIYLCCVCFKMNLNALHYSHCVLCEY